MDLCRRKSPCLRIASGRRPRPPHGDCLGARPLGRLARAHQPADLAAPHGHHRDVPLHGREVPPDAPRRRAARHRREWHDADVPVVPPPRRGQPRVGLRPVRSRARSMFSCGRNSDPFLVSGGDRDTPPHARASDGENLAPTREVQRQAPALSEISDRHLRSVLRPWWQAGWTVSDVLWCLDHTPDGELWPHTNRVRHIPGWVRYRLAAWSGHRSPSHDRAAWHARIRAEQAQLRAERRPPVDPKPWADTIRRTLRTRQCA